MSRLYSISNTKKGSNNKYSIPSLKAKGVKKNIILLILLLFSISSFAQNDNKLNSFLKIFLEEYPIYKNNVSELYFEHTGMNYPKNTIHYFNVYKQQYVGNENKRVQFLYNGQMIWGDIIYMLFPIVYSTYSPTVITDPNYKKPNVTNSIKCIILSKGGTIIIPLNQVFIN